jgi:hypothetical protein
MQVMMVSRRRDPGIGNRIASETLLRTQPLNLRPLATQRRHINALRIQNGSQECLCSRQWGWLLEYLGMCHQAQKTRRHHWQDRQRLFGAAIDQRSLQPGVRRCVVRMILTGGGHQNIDIRCYRAWPDSSAASSRAR